MNRKYDTFWPRLSAALWDGLIFLPLRFLNAWIHDQIHSSIIILWEVAFILAWPVYIIYMHGKYGQTIGKRKTDVIVLNIDENRIINYREATIRESPYLITVLCYLMLNIYYLLNPDKEISPQSVLIINILGYASILWFLLEILTMFLNNKRRAIHDYLAGTVIVRKEYIA